MAKRGIPWLDFSSAKERKKREEQFFAASFPFGEAQKERERTLLCALFPGKRDSMLLYHLLTLKEALREHDTAEEALAEWKCDTLTGELSEAEQKRMLRYTRRSMETHSLEEYPEAEDLEVWLGPETAGNVFPETTD